MLHRLNIRTIACAAIAGLAAAVVTIVPVSPAAADVGLEAESMALTAGAGAPYADAGASAGGALMLWSNGTASATTTTRAAKQLVVRAKGDLCSGAPRMDVRVNGALVLSAEVAATGWTDYAAPVSLTAGTHAVAIGYANDRKTKRCDRNLRLDRVRVVEDVVAPSPTTTTPGTTTSTTATTGPAGPTHALEGASLYVDPSSNAAREAAALRTVDPARAVLFDKIAGQSQADWVGDWVPAAELAANVNARIGTIVAAGAVPVFVSYAIPLRDCGSYSAGGISTPEGYRAWVRELANGIGGRKVAIILEPDALAQISCLTAVQQQDRLDLLAGAVATLTASGASVYVDAGHSAWVPSETIAARLQAAGVSGARGFSLNVSNFQPTTNEIAYGTQLAEQLGGKAFVVDTSRNGLGPYDGAESWCNPPGRALGGRPSTSTGVSGLDALLWVKRPGESDGTCRGGPSAGTWWPDYTAGLAERAAY